MEPQEHDAPPDYDWLGRLGSWHSYRLLAIVVGLLVWLAIPWHRIPTNRMGDLQEVAGLVSLAAAVPAWFAGVVARRGGVHLNYGGVVRRVRWDQIHKATVAWRGVEPRMRLELVDGRCLWAPGFSVPLSQRSSRQDGWRSTELFRAAQLITAEAERRRQEPPQDGTREWTPRFSMPPSGRVAVLGPR